MSVSIPRGPLVNRRARRAWVGEVLHSQHANAVNNPYPTTETAGFNGTWLVSATLTDLVIELAAAAGINGLMGQVHNETGIFWPAGDDVNIWPESNQANTPITEPGAEADAFRYALNKAATIDGPDKMLLYGKFNTIKDDRHDGTGGLQDYQNSPANGFLDVSQSAARDKLVGMLTDFVDRYKDHANFGGIALDFIRTGFTSATAPADILDVVTRCASAVHGAGLELFSWGHHSNDFYNNQGNQGAKWLNDGLTDGWMQAIYGYFGDTASGSETSRIAGILESLGMTAATGGKEQVDAAKRKRVSLNFASSRDEPLGEQNQKFMTQSELRDVFWRSQLLNPGCDISVFQWSRYAKGSLLSNAASSGALAVPSSSGKATIDLSGQSRTLEVPVDGQFYIRRIAGSVTDPGSGAGVLVDGDTLAGATRPGFGEARGWFQIIAAPLFGATADKTTAITFFDGRADTDDYLYASIAQTTSVITLYRRAAGAVQQTLVLNGCSFDANDRIRLSTRWDARGMRFEFENLTAPLTVTAESNEWVSPWRDRFGFNIGSRPFHTNNGSDFLLENIQIGAEPSATRTARRNISRR